MKANNKKVKESRKYKKQIEHLRKAALSKVAYDCAFQAGFVSGVKNQQDFEKSHFFTFWRYW